MAASATTDIITASYSPENTTYQIKVLTRGVRLVSVSEPVPFRGGATYTFTYVEDAMQFTLTSFWDTFISKSEDFTFDLIIKIESRTRRDRHQMLGSGSGGDTIVGNRMPKALKQLAVMFGVSGAVAIVKGRKGKRK